MINNDWVGGSATTVTKQWTPLEKLIISIKYIAIIKKILIRITIHVCKSGAEIHCKRKDFIRLYQKTG